MQDRARTRVRSDSESIGVLIGAIKRLMKQALWPHLAPYGLTPQQLRILLILRGGGISLHELALRMWSDDPTTSRMVRSLVRRRLVQARQDPEHRRRVRLVLTARGHRLSTKLKGSADSLLDRIEEGLNRAERAALRRSLRKIMANLLAMGAESPRAKAPQSLWATEARTS